MKPVWAKIKWLKGDDNAIHGTVPGHRSKSYVITRDIEGNYVSLYFHGPNGGFDWLGVDRLLSRAKSLCGEHAAKLPTEAVLWL